MSIAQFLADAWKGYSAIDVQTLRVKLESDEAKRLDGIILITSRELRALCAEAKNEIANQLEHRAGNKVYRAAWKAAAKMLKE